ncbi:MAG: capsule assembly Wzi family protein [bacterium]
MKKIKIDLSPYTETVTEFFVKSRFFVFGDKILKLFLIFGFSIVFFMELRADISDHEREKPSNGHGDFFSVPRESIEKGSVFVINENSFFKPLHSFEQIVLLTNEDEFFLPAGAGLSAEKGASSSLYADGYISVNELFAFYYQFRQTASQNNVDISVFRAFGKLRTGKLSFDFGRNDLSFGPGKYGVFLGGNISPFINLKMQTEESINFFGKWDFLAVKGWFKEERNDIDDPEILAVRITWQPFSWLKIGGTRTTFYGGAGRPTYYPWEYPKFILASEENHQPDVYDNRDFDNDAMAAWDVSFTIPMRWLWSDIEKFKFYFQQGGTDVHLIWQKDNNKFMEPTFPFFFMKFYDTSYTTGLFMEIPCQTFRLEYASTPYAFYTHHFYSQEGYTHDNIPIGHPYGRDMQSFLLEHSFSTEKDLSFSWMISYVQAPGKKQQYRGHGSSFRDLWPLFSSGNDIEKQWLFSFMTDKHFGDISLGGYFRYRYIRNFDMDMRANFFDISNKKRHFITGGISFSLKL